jgi:hypothetical protein
MSTVYTVRVEPDPEEKGRYTDEQQYRKKQIDAAIWLNRISAIGAAIAFLALLALIWYANISQGQLDGIHESNRINKSSSDLAYRPYIGVSNIEVLFTPLNVKNFKQVSQVPTDETKALSFKVDIKNFGPVPGTDFKDKMIFLVNGITVPGRGVPDSTFTMFPGQEVGIVGSIGTNDYPAVQHGDKVLEVETTVEYTGPTGKYKYCETARYEPNVNGFLRLGEQCTH